MDAESDIAHEPPPTRFGASLFLDTLRLVDFFWDALDDLRGFFLTFYLTFHLTRRIAALSERTPFLV